MRSELLIISPVKNLADLLAKKLGEILSQVTVDRTDNRKEGVELAKRYTPRFIVVDTTARVSDEDMNIVDFIEAVGNVRIFLLTQNPESLDEIVKNKPHCQVLELSGDLGKLVEQKLGLSLEEDKEVP